ncbi:hypothetical protein AALP_AA8G479100 [Arabis alpina]|uniref:Uncharacterized protein n=1 Tax=Arabis alpina TaxID=50452 RepID=A0A087GE49_ARAAL|nr:hypothetical protein AALP_AA8G479100 [Arabis alpina]
MFTHVWIPSVIFYSMKHVQNFLGQKYTWRVHIHLLYK